MSDGSIWASVDQNFVPASGTLLGTSKVNSSTSNQKIATLSGNSGAYALAGNNTKAGKEFS